MNGKAAIRAVVEGAGIDRIRNQVRQGLLKVVGWLGNDKVRPPPEAVDISSLAIHVGPAEPGLSISIFETTLCQIAGDAATWGGQETGWIFFGSWTQDGRPIIWLASPPGPNAVHDVAHFRPDVQYIRQLSEMLAERYDIHIIGEVHSHHELGLVRPSPGDVAHIQRLAAKNKLPRMIELILTCAGSAMSGRDHLGKAAGQEGPLVRGVTGNPQCPCSKLRRIQVNAYMYTDAPAGRYVPCDISVLSGTSPIQMALQDDPLWRLGRSDFQAELPLSWISFDSGDRPKEVPAASSKGSLPWLLAQQAKDLPGHLTDQARVLTQDDTVIVLLPAPRYGNIAIAYRKSPPNTPLAVHLIAGHGTKPLDLSGRVLAGSSNPTMWTLFERSIQQVRSLVQPEHDRSNGLIASSAASSGPKNHTPGSSSELRKDPQERRQ